MKQQNIKFSIITRQLISSLIIAALCFILLMGVIDVVWNYNNELETLNNNLNNIPSVYIDIITHSLWIFDDQQLENSVKSINNLSGVFFVSISTREGSIVSSGVEKAEKFESYEYELNYIYENKNVNLGKLLVHYQLPEFRRILLDNLIEIFMRVGFIVGLILIVIFVLVNYFIARPISILAAIIQEKSDYSTVEYSRKRIFKKHDEIDILVNAFNRIFEKIRHEIHEREDHAKKLIDSVNEKNVLISEVHHRVKNNLQIILSLLNLQKNESDNIEDALNATINRIRAMSEVHEQLYNSNDFSKISMHNYLNSLIGKMSELSFNIKIKMVSEDKDLLVALDIAIPLGLIINELILNSLKYAFPDGQGLIEIEILENSEEYSNIRVKDNGVGVKNVDELSRSSSLGFHIVESLVEQIDGKIAISSDSGLSVTISIPL